MGLMSSNEITEFIAVFLLPMKLTWWASCRFRVKILQWFWLNGMNYLKKKSGIFFHSIGLRCGTIHHYPAPITIRYHLPQEG